MSNKTIPIAPHPTNTPREPFPCNACGECCRRVGNSAATADLSRGDGVCRHLDENTNLCRIYENRPLVCQVENYYVRHLQYAYSWPEFVAINTALCAQFQAAPMGVQSTSIPTSV